MEVHQVFIIGEESDRVAGTLKIVALVIKGVDDGE